MKIATSILSSKNRTESVIKLNNTTTDYIHIDTMDGKFVNNTSMPVNEINKLGRLSTKPFDIHLMVEDPLEYINKIIILNTDCITIHVEIDKDILSILKTIKKRGIKAGIAINPNTDTNALDKYLDYVDKIIVMSVEPGYGGQKFIDSTIDKIKEIKKKNSKVTIEVDGGINDTIIEKISDIIDIAVVGSYITKSNNYQKSINTIKKSA